MKSQKGTWKLVSQKIFGEILSLRQVFSNLVSPPQAQKIFEGNTVGEPSFPDEKKKKAVAETSFDWNLTFLRKTKKKNNTPPMYQ